MRLYAFIATQNGIGIGIRRFESQVFPKTTMPPRIGVSRAHTVPSCRCRLALFDVLFSLPVKTVYHFGGKPLKLILLFL